MVASDGKEKKWISVPTGEGNNTPHTDRQTDRQTDTHTHTHTNTPTNTAALTLSVWVQKALYQYNSTKLVIAMLLH